jgi:hypothetical protein
LWKNKLSTVDKASITDVTMLLGSLYYKKVADINDKQTISVFNAATALVQSTENILMDFKTENGVEWKLFLNELQNLQSKQQLEKLDPTEEVSDREGKEIMKNELAEIELLIEKLALTKNRKEKRRLLAIYN